MEDNKEIFTEDVLCTEETSEEVSYETQSEIAENLGVSQVQVSRLENKIIEKIRLKF